MRLSTTDKITSAAGLLIILILIVVAILAPVIAPYDPTLGSLGDRLKPPVWEKGGSAAHLLGTDLLGRDTLSRVLFGARTSLTVAVVAILVAGTLGSTVGILAGYMGGWLDMLLMRSADAWMPRCDRAPRLANWESKWATSWRSMRAPR